MLDIVVSLQRNHDRDHRMKFFVVLFVLTFTAIANGVDPDPLRCVPLNGITPICGFASPEDIDVMPGAKALVVGGLGGFSLDDANGDMRILRLDDHSITTIFPPYAHLRSSNNLAPKGDPACPGPPVGFSAHGIHVSTNIDTTLTLLVVNHTGREAIEWLEVSERDGEFSARWRGCVIVPKELWINDVAMLADGGFVATHMMPRDQASTIFDRQPGDSEATG
jgi:hypothetical protein